MKDGPEETRTRRRHRPWPCAALAAALALAASAGAPLAGQGRQPAMTGEHGLGVWVDGDGLVVRWLTEGAVRGLLEASVDGEVVRRDTTPASGAHRVRFERPAAAAVTLRYGALSAGSSRAGHRADLHETTIALEDGGDGDGRDGRGRSVHRGVDSLYVVGDVHGEHDRLRGLLENAGLIDAAGAWSGGRRHLVMLGDLVDRGPDVTRTLWFLYRLEREARAAGGRVHVVLGNHEIMVLTGDHRYVPPKERLVARRHGLSYTEMFDVERSVLGRWLAAKPAALRFDDVLLVHGGIGPAYLGWSVPALNDSLRAWVSEDLFRYWSDSTVEVAPMDSTAIARRFRFFFREPGPFWYRGYATADTLDAAVDRVLEAHDARLQVIAHTPVRSIRASYGGRVILVDLRRPASELLRLVRSGEGWERRVVGLEGPPRPLGAAGGPP